MPSSSASSSMKSVAAAAHWKRNTKAAFEAKYRKDLVPEKDSGIFRPLAALGDKSHIENLTGWRNAIAHFFESNWFQFVILVLIVIDVVVVIVELVVGFGILGFQDEHVGHQIEHVMHTISVGILAVFMIELSLMTAVVPGLTYLTGNKWHLLDFVVVAGSLVCDVVLTSYAEGCVSHGDSTENLCGDDISESLHRLLHESDVHNESIHVAVEEAVHGDAINCESGSIFSLLIMLRAWRVVRIVHGITEVAKKTTAKVLMLDTLVGDVISIQDKVVDTCLKELKLTIEQVDVIMELFKTGLEDTLEEMEDNSDAEDQEKIELNFEREEAKVHAASLRAP